MIGATRGAGNTKRKEGQKVSMEKRCSKCMEIKPLEEFSPAKHVRDGRRSCCRLCRKLASALYRKANPQRVRENDRRWRKEHQERDATSNRRWREANIEKVRMLYRRYGRELRSTPRGKLSRNVSFLIGDSLCNNKNNRHWEDLVGYTVDILKKHLEKRFKPEMTWENYGAYWHIDHKIPIAAFNFEKPEDLDFRRCWSLKNLQPLESKQNMSKGAKIDKPFQPSLSISI